MRAAYLSEHTSDQKWKTKVDCISRKVREEPVAISIPLCVVPLMLRHFSWTPSLMTLFLDKVQTLYFKINYFSCLSSAPFCA
jgi:hypothetical protein